MLSSGRAVITSLSVVSLWFSSLRCRVEYHLHLAICTYLFTLLIFFLKCDISEELNIPGNRRTLVVYYTYELEVKYETLIGYISQLYLNSTEQSTEWSWKNTPHDCQVSRTLNLRFVPENRKNSIFIFSLRHFPKQSAVHELEMCTAIKNSQN